MLQLPILGVLAVLAAGLAWFLKVCTRSMAERMNSLRGPEVPLTRRRVDMI